MHDKGYKFTDRIQDLTRKQLVYLSIAEEVISDIKKQKMNEGMNGAESGSNDITRNKLKQKAKRRNMNL